MRIYHIVPTDDWARAARDEFYEAESLKREGFIHCSFASQVDDVLDRYYAGEDSVIILEIETGLLSSRLVEETSTNEEVYPHIYGRINADSITSIEKRVPGNRDGAA